MRVWRVGGPEEGIGGGVQGRCTGLGALTVACSRSAFGAGQEIEDAWYGWLV